jgi:heme/copper-type cytochrome/quinol oxidase subunit 2
MDEKHAKSIIDLLWLIVVILVIIAGTLAGVAWRIL